MSTPSITGSAISDLRHGRCDEIQQGTLCPSECLSSSKQWPMQACCTRASRIIPMSYSGVWAIF